MNHESERIAESEKTNSETLYDVGEFIVVKGAREHNLKNVNLTVPREALVTITGVSGSGKSSLAFDTLYAEGQRRYIESFSSYARQFLGALKKPDVDLIEGLSPAVSVEQKTLSANPRSTVGTVTEIYDYIRLLYAKIGVQYCVDCRVPVQKKSFDKIIEEILKKFDGKKIQILSPLVRGRKGHYKELFASLLRKGFTKVRIDGKIRPLEFGTQIERYKTHNIELVVDRCEVSAERERRIYESSKLALKMGDESLIILSEEDGVEKETYFSSKYSCPSCGRAYKELSPNMFSYNSPYGACPRCSGLGVIKDFDEKLIIADENLSIAEGGLALLGEIRDNWLWKQVLAFAKSRKIDVHKPIKELSEKELKLILYGEGETKVETFYEGAWGRASYFQTFYGIIPSFRHHYKSTSSSRVANSYENYMSSKKCDLCGGGRLKIENLNVFVAGKSIDEITAMDIDEAREFFENLSSVLNEKEKKIAEQIIKEISARLEFLQNVGLSYLTLDRPSQTLSGGESQRIKLASQIGQELTGALYALDEPTIGLHPSDNHKLIATLKKLVEQGNSVIVVEHDRATIEASDWIVDIGPGAGSKGGEILFVAKPSEIASLDKSIIDRSLTAQYLLRMKKIESRTERREGNGKKIILYGARGNNLKNVTLTLPLGKLICVVGVSGSGKSSLINDTLYPILSRKFYRTNKRPLPYDKIEGLENVDKAIEIDQSPIGRTPRSNPATYAGAFAQIRELFASLPEAKVRGYKPGRFSFNVKGGRCEECEGAGLKKIEMNFLPDVFVVCDACGGSRYNKETLEVKYKGKSIADVLDMTINEALDFFKDIPKIYRRVKTLRDVGLGYMKLGQQAPALSGGEAQRVKLAAELSKVSTGKTLYFLDEPTTGLHFEDIKILMKLLNELVDKGNTVIIVEHNADVIKLADWVIELGPGGGKFGGEIIAEGVPEDLAKNPASPTGKFLAKEL